MPVPYQSVFTGQMPFLPPNQRHQSTEGTGLTILFNPGVNLGDMLSVDGDADAGVEIRIRFGWN